MLLVEYELIKKVDCFLLLELKRTLRELERDTKAPPLPWLVALTRSVASDPRLSPHCPEGRGDSCSSREHFLRSELSFQRPAAASEGGRLQGTLPSHRQLTRAQILTCSGRGGETGPRTSLGSCSLKLCGAI